MFQNSETEDYVREFLISTKDNLGEIESIQIQKLFRKFGLGGKFVEIDMSCFKLNVIRGLVYDLGC